MRDHSRGIHAHMFKNLHKNEQFSREMQTNWIGKQMIDISTYGWHKSGNNNMTSNIKIIQ